MTKMLNSENVLAQSGLSDSAATNLTADRILYQHAVSQCQEAALDELLGSPGGCVQVGLNWFWRQIQISSARLPIYALHVTLS